MGQKVHPGGFRLGINKDWRAKWYADKLYAQFLQEDIHIREAIKSRYEVAGISNVEIDRQGNDLAVTIHTSRPGIVIGRGGQRVEELGKQLRGIVGKKVQVNIREIRQPELDAYLVAGEVAGQLSRRITFRRAMRRAISRTMEAGAKGIKITCSGRLGGLEIARSVTMREGRVPLHTLRADIDYGLQEAHTTFGRIGVKAWIYKGDIVPQPREEEVLPPVAPAAGERGPSIAGKATASEGEKDAAAEAS